MDSAAGPQPRHQRAICERLVGTLRRESFDRTLILGEAHVRAVLAEYRTAQDQTGSAGGCVSTAGNLLMWRGCDLSVGSV